VKIILQKFLILPLLLCLMPLFGQNYGKGADLDPVRYEQTDAKPVLHTRNYTALPSSVSLKKYSPIPESQGQYGTCVAWSTAFAARTISESFAINRTDRTVTSNSVFSPFFVYKSASNDPTFSRGMVISDALDFMKDPGIVKRLPVEKNTDFKNINISIFHTSPRYPIAGYVRLFSNPRSSPGTIEERVLPVKKSLSEGKPVIIGMNCPDSFQEAKDFWRPTENPRTNYSGHAMCAVGYDDNKYGGAFEITNTEALLKFKTVGEQTGVTKVISGYGTAILQLLYTRPTKL